MKTEIIIGKSIKVVIVSGLLVLTACDQSKAPDTSVTESANATSDSQLSDKKEFTVPNKEELREKLTPLQYKVTQKDGTEPPFDNKYWDNKEPGIYVDIVSGEPLFSSTAKYESGTGWPSFYEPLDPANIVEHEDRKLWMTRTEVRSKHADSHLGHVFPDGPAPTGLRYCMNSASMRFVPASKLREEGYEDYAKLFEPESSEKSDS